MSDQIIAVLDDLSKRLGIAANWTSENIVPYAQELMQKIVRYELATSIAWIIIGFIVIMIASIVFKYLKKHPKLFVVDHSYGEDRSGRIFCYIALILIIAMFTTNILVQCFDIIKCITFPEKVVFEYVQDVINSNVN